MFIRQIGSSNAIQDATASNLNSKSKSQPVSHPGTAQASTVETARAEVNAASLMTTMMMPSFEGISIGDLAQSVTTAIKAVAKVDNWSSWGF